MVANRKSVLAIVLALACAGQAWSGEGKAGPVEMAPLAGAPAAKEAPKKPAVANANRARRARFMACKTQTTQAGEATGSPAWRQKVAACMKG